MEMTEQHQFFTCSRCRIDIAQPVYVCESSHVACEKCRKVFCQICRHLFEDRSEAIERGEITFPSSSNLSRRETGENPFQPNDGTIKFGEPFRLPKRGMCKFYATIDSQQVVFSWKINPNEGLIEVDVHPKEYVGVNWFMVEFSTPSSERRKMKKEWAVNHTLMINYNEVELFYEEDVVICKIHVQGIPYGNVVKPMEDKVKDAFASVFKKK